MDPTLNRAAFAATAAFVLGGCHRSSLVGSFRGSGTESVTATTANSPTPHPGDGTYRRTASGDDVVVEHAGGGELHVVFGGCAITARMAPDEHFAMIAPEQSCTRAVGPWHGALVVSGGVHVNSAGNRLVVEVVSDAVGPGRQVHWAYRFDGARQ